MSKKSNSVWFMLGATVVNILIMGVLFIVCVGLVVLLGNAIEMSPNVLMILLGIAFVGSIGGSFVIYSKLLGWVVDKYKLEDKLDPLFGKKKK